MGEINNGKGMPPQWYRTVLTAPMRENSIWFLGISVDPLMSLAAHGVEIQPKKVYYFYDSLSTLFKAKALIKESLEFIPKEQRAILNISETIPAYKKVSNIIGHGRTYQAESYVLMDDTTDYFTPTDQRVAIYIYKVMSGVTDEQPDIESFRKTFIPIEEKKIEATDQGNDVNKLPPDLLRLLNSIPWNNIVHFYGRAGEFPDQIAAIFNQDESAYRTIGNNIEHQDSISQATPFMLQVLLELLKYKEINPIEVLKICRKVWDAVQFYFTYSQDIPTPFIIKKQEDMLKKEYLWPDFIDEETDEMLWEEFVGGNVDYWNYFTMKLFYDYKEEIGKQALSENITIQSLTKELENNKYINLLKETER